ncbi:MAG: AmmeMemoRadiSam system protein B, partial [Anaerolineales bacterium]|nr:AmmeMemoRadiSam system protein B [Anaerolineales bacterium]
MDIRPSPIAGRWYPGTARELKRVVSAYLEAARPEGLPQSIIGLIAPHAGLRYSGPVAACAFKAVQGMDVQTVVIVCPSHFHDDAAVLTSAHAGYATPLGVVPVERAGLRRLRAALPKLDWAE